MKKLSAYLLIALAIPMVTGCSTPLHNAAAKGDSDAISEILEKRDFEGFTPLHVAAYYGKIDAARVIIEKGGDVNARDDGDNTPLHWSAYWGHTAIVVILIEKGADVNARGQYGDTPLHKAAGKGHTDIAKLLIEKGADLNARNNKGKTPLQIAEGKGHRGLAEMLVDIEKEKRFAKKSESSAPTDASKVKIIKSDIDELPPIKSKPNKNFYAIVIGIEKYRQKIPTADFAVNDAQTVTNYLTKVMGYPEENVITLLNDRALKSDMEKYFEKWLWNNVEKDGTVFIYYSGHGAPNPKTGDAYLVPYDGDPAFIDETGYSLKRLYEKLGKLQAKEIVVALDSCFSGAGGRSVLAKGARPLVMTMDKSAIPSNTAVLSAASGDQISSTYEEKGHGLFTYFMLKGIKGEGDANKDGSVDLHELFEYIKPQVERIARKVYNNEQMPQLIAPEERHRMILLEGAK